MSTLAIHSKTISKTTFNSLLQVLGGSLFLALCAQISFPLPFTPVPLTAQTFAVMLLGGFLGPKKGVLAVLAYLCEIGLGLPFLAGGVIKPLAIIGTNGGYLVGMLFQAYIVGWFTERKMIFPGIFLGIICQFGLGMMWLSSWVGLSNVFAMGAFPFLPGDILKGIIAVWILNQWKKS